MISLKTRLRVEMVQNRLTDNQDIPKTRTHEASPGIGSCPEISRVYIWIPVIPSGYD